MAWRSTLRFGLLTCLCAPAWPGTAQARTWTVDNDRVQFPTADFTRVMDAVSVTTHGDEVVVHPGIYTENLRLPGHDLHLRSSNPTDPGIVETTVIDGRFLGSVVSFDGAESPDFILEGFTLQRGQNQQGGGIFAGEREFSRATIRNNLIRDNVAIFTGGGIYACRGLITGNRIINNRAQRGGGISGSEAVIENNTISGNSASQSGGGIRSCNNVIRRNIIEGNRAAVSGGGLSSCLGLVEDNQVLENSANDGGGAAQLNGIARGNLFSANHASNRGGGVTNSTGSIVGNLIEKNDALNGGGIADCAGALEDNRIQNNLALQSGGGIFDCDGPITGNQITGNKAAARGGGVAASAGTLRGNRIASNAAPFGGGVADATAPLLNNRIEMNRADGGGGLFNCIELIQGNLLQANAATSGSALAQCRGVIQHNTIAFNRNPLNDSSTSPTAWLAPGALARSNLVYRNHGAAFGGPAGLTEGARVVLRDNLINGHPLLYRSDGGLLATTIDGLHAALPDSGGTLDDDPRFVNPAGADGDPWAVDDNDLHLRGDSPAIDRASLHVMTRPPAWDLDGQCRIAGAAPDLGAYEHNSLADRDGDGMPDYVEIFLGGSIGAMDTDDDGVIDGLERFRGGAPNRADAPNGLSVPGDAPTPQQALLLAVRGESIEIAPGRYCEQLRAGGKDFRLIGALDSNRRDAPGSPNDASAPIIDAAGSGPIVHCEGSETSATLIEGLVLRDGWSIAGSAVEGNGSTITLRANLIVGCVASEGGTIERVNGLIALNLILENSAGQGGAARGCHGSLTSNTLQKNVAKSGGALFDCDGPVVGNRFRENKAQFEGGAAARCDGAWSENGIENNQAGQGGGLHSSGAALRNCILRGNSATGGGGAIALHAGPIEDCEVSFNKAAAGGGFFACDGPITRCLVQGNRVTTFGAGFASCRAPISECLVTSGSALNGGGFADCSGPIRNNRIVDNVAEFNGGGVATSYGPIEGNLVAGNRALVGGGFHDCIRVIGNAIRQNVATAQGGGLASCNGEIRGNVIEGNLAEEGGGLQRCNQVIEANFIQGNSATKLGGAIREGIGVIRNNVFQGNRAPHGAAIHGVRGELLHNTLAHHSDATVGVVEDSIAALRNNIFFRNAGATIASGTQGVMPTVVQANCIFGQGDAVLLASGDAYATVAEMEAALGSAAADNLELDPQLLAPAGVDGLVETFGDNRFDLLPTSPCLDAAAEILATDLLGHLRPVDGNVDGIAASDIGAYEFYYVLITNPGMPSIAEIGAPISIGWLANAVYAGMEFRFELWRGGRREAILGTGRGGMEAVETTFLMPAVPPGEGYAIRAVSLADERLYGASPAQLTVIAPRSAASGWTHYR